MVQKIPNPIPIHRHHPNPANPNGDLNVNPPRTGERPPPPPPPPSKRSS